MYGKIISSWKRDGDKLSMNIVVPPNTTAEITIPAKDVKMITENNKEISTNKDIHIINQNEGKVIVEVGSGNYLFGCTL